MFCTKCGSEIKAGNKFCTKCGKPVAQVQQKDRKVVQRGEHPQKLQPHQVQKAAQKLEQPQKSQTRRQEEAKGKGLLLALVIILVVVLAGGAAVIGYLILGRDKGEASDKNNNESVYEMDSENETEKEAVSDAEAAIATEAKMEETDTETELAAEAEYVPDMNIHRYGFFVDDCSWSAAQQKAKESGGYLVRIESRAEYEYILSEIQRGGYGNIQFRIGARRNPNELNYYWVDEDNNTIGEPIQVSGYWCENEWMDNEPSYADGDLQEECIDMFYYSGAERWVWNDVPDDIISIAPGYSGRVGYIVEYEN